MSEKDGRKQDDGRPEVALFRRFQKDHPNGVVETVRIKVPIGADGRITTGVAALVWRDPGKAQAGRQAAEEALRSHPELNEIEEIEIKAPDAVGSAPTEALPSTEEERLLSRLALGQALERLFNGVPGLPEGLLASRGAKEPEEVPAIVPMGPCFDLRGPGSSWRGRVARIFGRKPFLRQEGQERCPATGGQRIFVAHLMLRAARTWEEIKAKVAALRTWGDIDQAKAELIDEIHALAEAEEVGEVREDLPSLKQWLLIGDLITDQKLHPVQAEQLWLRASTREQADLVISQLQAGRPFARVA